MTKCLTKCNKIACSRLSVSGGLKKRAGDEWGLVGKKETESLEQAITKQLVTVRDSS